MLDFSETENKKRLNDRIRELLDANLELTEDGKGDVEEEVIEPMFPEILWAEDKDKCVSRFYEFRARLKDDFMHKVTQLEWLMLHQLYYEWNEIYEDYLKHATTSKEKAEIRRTLALLNELSDNLDCDGEYLPQLFELYKTGSPRLAELGHKDLDEFIELMPRDILREYLTLKAERSHAT